MRNNIPQYPYNNLYNMQTHENVERLDKEIKELEEAPTKDQHKIYRLREQKLLEGMFSSDQIGCGYGRFRNPW